MIKDIREKFTEATEALADKAVDKGQLTIGDFADVILDFYKVLPKDLFKNVRLADSPPKEINRTKRGPNRPKLNKVKANSPTRATSSRA